MKAVRTLKNQAGFSLVELMIVVAIIGILATVAIPNFTRFQAKARQSNGKAILSGYATAQKAAYAEFTYFPGNPAGAGMKIEGTLTYRLTTADNTGAAGAGPGNTADTALAAACLITNDAANCTAAGKPYVGMFTENSYAAATAVCAAANSNTAPGLAGTFTACASANIGAAALADVWSVNQLGTIGNSQDGLP